MASELAHTKPRLAPLPTTAIALVLGISIGQPQRPTAYGRVSTLIDELRRRGEWDAIAETLDPDLLDSIAALESADRGQRWAHTGRRP